MFDNINLKGLAKSDRFGYAAKQDFFVGRKKIQFKPGLNILFGPNGSGKSTVLNMLGETMCAVQGGVSTVTHSALRDTVELMSSRSASKKTKNPDKIGLAIVHDGQPVVFCDPRQTVGLIGGGFDDDFFGKGVSETMNNRTASHGQKTLCRVNDSIAILLGKSLFPEEVDFRFKRSSVNDMWGSAFDIIEARMKGSIAKAQPTFLLDEPESNYSLLWQSRLWSLLSRAEICEKFQIIVATHSVFSLGIEHANYIDLKDGFREEIEVGLRAKFGQKLM
jgi:predicted ATPase